MYIYGHKKKEIHTTQRAGRVRVSTPVCMRSYLHRGAHACTRTCTSMYTEMQYPFSFFLSLSLSVLCVLARRGKHNDGERAKLRASVRSFVRSSGTRVGNRR